MFVETIRRRTRRLLTIAQMPLSEVRRSIACLLQDAKQGHDTGVQPIRHSAGLVDLWSGKVSMDLVPSWKMAGGKSRTTRRADRIAHIKLGEERSLPGETIEVGCLDVAMSIAAEVTPAKVVGEYEDDVR